KRNLGWPEDRDFYIPDKALAKFREAVGKGREEHAHWQRRFDAWAAENPKLAKDFADGFSNTLPAGWDRDIPTFAPGEAIATRASAGKALSAIAPNYPALFGGSADLNSSTETALKGMGDFENPALASDADEEGP